MIDVYWVPNSTVDTSKKQILLKIGTHESFMDILEAKDLLVRLQRVVEAAQGTHR